MGRVIFVTGTDTGVGKTILTGLLLAHARRSGVDAAGLKPFCSGGREDAELLWELQNRELPLEVVNPFWFREPLSPWTAARLEGRRVGLKEAVEAIRQVQAEVLVVEGAGGLLAPLGERFTAVELMQELGAEVIVAAGNRLGVLNHAQLTLEVLRSRGLNSRKVVLMDGGAADRSRGTNREDLQELAEGVAVFELRHLEECQAKADWISRASEGLGKWIEEVLG